jgi:hypothetical protein
MEKFLRKFPNTIILAIVMAIVITILVSWARAINSCEDKGGEMVRTLSGYYKCVKVEEIK